METCALPEVALEDAEKTSVPLLPAVNDRGDGETDLRRSPKVETYIDTDFLGHRLSVASSGLETPLANRLQRHFVELLPAGFVDPYVLTLSLLIDN